MTRSAAGKSLEDRVVSLLSNGLPPGKVAEICGVDASRISQLMDSPEFKSKLQDTRYEQAVQYSSIDTKLNSLEERVIDGLDKTIGMVFDPLKLARILQVVNGAKRRGSQILGEGMDVTPVVPLTLPVKIVNNFVVNTVNQVVQAGGEDLITIQPSQMKELANEQSTLKLTDTKVSQTLKLPNLRLTGIPKKSRLDTV